MVVYESLLLVPGADEEVGLPVSQQDAEPAMGCPSAQVIDQTSAGEPSLDGAVVFLDEFLQIPAGGGIQEGERLLVVIETLETPLQGLAELLASCGQLPLMFRGRPPRGLVSPESPHVFLFFFFFARVEDSRLRVLACLFFHIR